MYGPRKIPTPFEGVKINSYGATLNFEMNLKTNNEKGKPHFQLEQEDVVG